MERGKDPTNKMKKYTQVKTFVVPTTWKEAKTFDNYEEAWKYAEYVFSKEGRVLAVETLYN
jgi:hypothetical protein